MTTESAGSLLECVVTFIEHARARRSQPIVRLVRTRGWSKYIRPLSRWPGVFKQKALSVSLLDLTICLSPISQFSYSPVHVLSEYYNTYVAYL